MKAQVQKALHKEEYNIEDFYFQTGICQGLARSKTFQLLGLMMIVLNLLWIGISTDLNKATVLVKAPLVVQVFENLFTIFFVCELLIRFMALKRKCAALNDVWFVIDTVLVLLMIWETWIEVLLWRLFGNALNFNPIGTQLLRIFRVVRITRMARLMRLLHYFPEMMVLFSAILCAVRSVLSTLVLLVVTVYIFAVFFVQMLADTDAAHGCFDSVPLGMHCLMINGIFSSQADILNDLLKESLASYASMLVYSLVASLTLGNLLIGVICEVVGNVANIERDRVMINSVKHKISHVLFKLDADHSKSISRKELVSLLENPAAVRLLNDVGVNPACLVDAADFIFKEVKELSFEHFLEMVLQFRGSNHATVKNLVDMQTFITQELSILEGRLGSKLSKLLDSRMKPSVHSRHTSRDVCLN